MMGLKQCYRLGLPWSFHAVATWIWLPSLQRFFSGKEDPSTLLGIGMSAASPSSFPRPLQSWKPTSASLQVPPSPEDVARPHVLEVCAEDTVIR